MAASSHREDYRRSLRAQLDGGEATTVAWERAYSRIPSEPGLNYQDQMCTRFVEQVTGRAIPRFFNWVGEYSYVKSMKPCYHSEWYRKLSCGGPAGSRTTAQVSASLDRSCGPFLATRWPLIAIARTKGRSLCWAGAFHSVS